MKQRLKKTGRSVLCMMLVLCMLVGGIAVVPSQTVCAATEDGQAAEQCNHAELAAGKTITKHVAKRGMYHEGDYLYMQTNKGVCAYSLKKHTIRYIVKDEGIDEIITYKGYLYYNAYKNKKTSIYKVKLTGKSKPKQLCKNGQLGFIQNDRLYYGHSGLCSMKLDGTGKKCHMRVKDNWTGYVFYYKGNYYYSGFPYTCESYSVDAKFKHRKKYKAGDDKVSNAFVRAFDDMESASSLTVKGYQYWTDDKTRSIRRGGAYYFDNTKEVPEKKIYQSSKKKLCLLSACPDYIMFWEGNKGYYEGGTVKIIDTEGHVIGTVKRNYIL